jgi:hypothetical protein
MNLGKFHSVIDEIHSYYEEHNILREFQQLIDMLQTSISTQSIETTTSFRTQLSNFLDLSLETPQFSNMASFQEVIDETNGFSYFGEGLYEAINEIIHVPFISNVELLAKLTSFQKELQEYVTHTKRISAGLGALQVEYDDISEDDFEFAALLPKELVGDTLENIQSEVQHLDRLFKALNELMGKGSESPKVKTISSSWWQFFLSLDHTQIAAVTFAIERIVNLYKTNLEIRKLKSDAEKLGMDEQVVQLINKQVEAKIKEGMTEIAKEMRDKFKDNKDDARCNELEIQIRQELFTMAKRINQGAIYEVKAAIPEKPEEAALSQDAELTKKVVSEYQIELEKYEKKLEYATKINKVNDLILEMSESLIEQDHLLLIDYDNLKD